MSILRSLNTGASGLRSHGEALSVTGDNIANVNTVGFKGSRATFQDVLGRAVAGGGGGAGAGSTVGHIEQMWSQGALLVTDAATDLAISGNGFFVVEGNLNGMQGRFYTRAGQFQIDTEGRLVNPDNLRLKGYMANAQGVLSPEVTDLTVMGQTVPATATTEMTIAMNLDANATVPAAWDPTDAANTSNFANTIAVYDSLGNAHEISVYYRRDSANAWEWYAMVDGGSIGGTPGAPTQVGSGTLTFSTDGALDTETGGPLSLDFTGATPGQTIALDFGESLAEGGTGLEGSTQFAQPSSTTGLTQDGYTAGTVTGISVGSDGTITGIFSNGQRRMLGQLAVASFRNVDGLERTGKGMWVSSQESGEALLGSAETGGRGSIVAGALEGSNVDLGKEFVNLISYQRGFQASSRIITTSDEMYNELVNLKR